MNHLYLRLAWSYLEPQAGKFNCSVIDNVINKWIAKGYSSLNQTSFFIPKVYYRSNGDTSLYEDSLILFLNPSFPLNQLTEFFLLNFTS
ncbi:MAG: hypothetical protein N4J56_003194 [Chroococcidiopsis sp. SAG 2025]|nr:hypothetical protein [Chroococcidiopsis sp. SAG 2025]